MWPRSLAGMTLTPPYRLRMVRSAPAGSSTSQHGDAAGDAGDEPRGVVPVVHRVGVGTCGDEQPGDVDVVAERSEQQRSAATLVAGLDRAPASSAAHVPTASPVAAAVSSCSSATVTTCVPVGRRHCRPISAACSAAAVSANFSGLAWMTTSCSVPVKAYGAR